MDRLYLKACRGKKLRDNLVCHWIIMRLVDKFKTRCSFMCVNYRTAAENKIAYFIILAAKYMLAQSPHHKSFMLGKMSAFAILKRPFGLGTAAEALLSVSAFLRL